MNWPMLSRPRHLSYGIIVVTLVLVGWQHLAMPLLAALFGYFALEKLCFGGRKWLAITLFILLAGLLAYSLGYFVKRTVADLPTIAEKAIPSVIQWAQGHQIELPFTDYDSLKDVALDTVKAQSHTLGTVANFARGATKEFLYLLVGLVLAISVFLNAQLELNRGAHRIQNNLYSLTCDEIAARFGAFYQSFAAVMGAQIVISAINTLFTTVFVLVVKLPHPVVIIGMTFLCGMLPVIGNLLSNIIIVAVGFTVSPGMALACLIFLVVIHKLEYFLNSKIIGARINNPIWVTLLGLIIGEKLMGIPGMILAPVVLFYLKTDAAQVPVPTAPAAPAGPEEPAKGKAPVSEGPPNPPPIPRRNT